MAEVRRRKTFWLIEKIVCVKPENAGQRVNN